MQLIINYSFNLWSFNNNYLKFTPTKFLCQDSFTEKKSEKENELFLCFPV